MTKHLITCPHCGESYDPLSAAAGQDLGEYLAVLVEFGEHRALARDYIGLFRASLGSAMRLSTRLKIARELLRLWRTGRYQYDGREYRVSRDAIIEGVHQTVQALQGRAGLKNHNYLKKVLLAAYRQEAARRERRVEASRRAGDHRKTRPAPAGDRRLPERLGAGDSPDAPPERPLWEGTPEQVVAALVMAYGSPATEQAMPHLVRRLEQAVSRAGVDLARLRAETERLPEGYGQDPGLGRRLLERCRRSGEGDRGRETGGCMP